MKGLLYFVIGVFQVASIIAQPIHVVGTASMFADMTKSIGGDLVTSSSIVPIGSDPHTYEPTPKDIILIQSADIVLINGLTFDGWISDLIENSGTEADISLITSGIRVISSEIYHNATDPHAWMEPENGKIYAQNIAQALIKKLPEHTEEILTRLEAYTDELQNLHMYATRRINEIPIEERILITSHDAFQYFGRQYGIKLESTLGISTEADIRTRDMMRLHALIQKSQVKAIFIESTINPKVIQQIASQNAIIIGGELYADSLGEPGSGAETYLSMLKHNIDTYVDAMIGKTENHSPHDSANNYSSTVYFFLGAMMIGVFIFSIFKLNGNI